MTNTEKPCSRNVSGASGADMERSNEALRGPLRPSLHTGDVHVLDIARQKQRRQERTKGATSALRESYHIDGDGVAHADLKKLVRRPGFKSSARKIIERNRLLKNGL